MNQRFLIIIFFLTVSFCPYANGQFLNKGDRNDIRYFSYKTIKDYENLLRFITDKNLNYTDIQQLIKNSYSDQSLARSKIFYNNEVIIEDDLNPTFLEESQISDSRVESYLKDLDLFYTKADTFTIDFADLKVSDVSQKEFIYTKVYFKSIFQGGHKNSEQDYATVERVATVRATMLDNKWKTFIMGISFFDPDRDSLVRDKSNYDQEQKTEENEKEDNAELERILSVADSAFNAGDFVTALQNYTEAMAIDPFDIDIRKKIQTSIAKLREKEESISKNFELVYNKAIQAEKFREFTLAKEYYQQALELNPTKLGIANKIKDLNLIISKNAYYESLYKNGRYDELEKEYSKLLRRRENRDIPEYYLGRAKCYMSLGDYDKAEKDIQDALSISPDYFEARVVSADLYEHNGELEKALADLSVAFELYPDKPKLIFRKAQLNKKLQNRSEARNSFMLAKTLLDKEIALDSYTEEPLANLYFYRGICLANLDQVEKAASDLQNAQDLGIKPEFNQAIVDITNEQYEKGVAEYQSQVYEEAIEFFINTIHLKPDHISAWFMKGESFFMQKDYLNAMENYNQVTELDNQHANAYYKLGLCKFYLRDYRNCVSNFHAAYNKDQDLIAGFLYAAEAYININEYTKAVDECKYYIDRAKSNDGKAHTLAGYASYLNQDYEAALEYLDDAVSKKDTDNAYLYRGLVYRELNKNQRSNADLGRYLDQNPRDPQRHYQLGNSNYYLNKIEEAVENYSASIALDPMFLESYYRRANAYIEIDKYDSALMDLEFLHENNFDSINSDYNLQLGYLYILKEDYQKAIEVYNHAEEYLPDNSNLNFGLACAYSLAGDTDIALQLYEKAFKSNQFEWKMIRRESAISKMESNPQFKQLVKKYLN